VQLVHLWVVSWNRQPIVRMENVERNATDEEQADKVLDAIDLAHRSRVPAALVESIAMQETDAESRVRGVSWVPRLAWVEVWCACARGTTDPKTAARPRPTHKTTGTTALFFPVLLSLDKS
jgi:hypothetical protein